VAPCCLDDLPDRIIAHWLSTDCRGGAGQTGGDLDLAHVFLSVQMHDQLTPSSFGELTLGHLALHLLQLTLSE
jgi:hypothetical protein